MITVVEGIVFYQITYWLLYLFFILSTYLSVIPKFIQSCIQVLPVKAKIILLLFVITLLFSTFLTNYLAEVEFVLLHYLIDGKLK